MIGAITGGLYGAGAAAPASFSIDYLVIAGGGSGGGAGGYGGGGGAGGLRSTIGTTGGGGSLESQLTISGSFTVTVGAGGSGSSNGSNGSNSVLSSIPLTLYKNNLILSSSDVSFSILSIRSLFKSLPVFS